MMLKKSKSKLRAQPWLLIAGLPASLRNAVRRCLPAYDIHFVKNLADLADLADLDECTSSTAAWHPSNQIDKSHLILSPGPLDHPVARSFILYPAELSLRETVIAQRSNLSSAGALLDSADKIIAVARQLNDGASQLQQQRVLILGGDESASVLVDLANLVRHENPGVEIVFKPGRAKFALTALQARGIMTSSEPLAKLVKTVSRVYTVDSPAGLEVLLFGLPLTVTGEPFYYGFGLTDDRSEKNALDPKISLTELFCISALMLPLYEAAPNDPISGALTAIMLTTAEVQQPFTFKMNLSFLVQSALERFRKLGERHRLFSILDSFCPGSKEPVDSIVHSMFNLKDSCIIKSGRWRQSLQLAEKCLEARKFDEAEEICLRLMQSSCRIPRIFAILAECRFLRGQFDQAADICQIGASLFPLWRSGYFGLSAGRYHLLAGQTLKGWRYISCVILNRWANPHLDISASGLVVPIKRHFGNLPWEKVFVATGNAVGRSKTVNWGKSLIQASNFDEAEKVFGQIKKNSVAVSLGLAQTYRFQNRFEDAADILKPLIISQPCTDTYDEALKLCLLSDDKTWAEELIGEAEKKNIQFRDKAALWLALIGLGRVKEAFLEHGQASYFNVIKPYLGEQVITELSGHEKMVRRALVMSECFTGDEIRFSRLYPQIAKKIMAEEVTFTCDPRLYSLFSNSFPDLNFLPVLKVHTPENIDDFSKFDQLPGLDASRYLDNVGWSAVQESNRVISVMHAISSVASDYESWHFLPELKADHEIKATLRSMLPSSDPKLLAGLSWRTCLSRYDRNIAMSSLEQLDELLELDGIQWVNCQYDGLKPEEIDYFEQRHHGRLLTLDLDQLNDIDKTAALYDLLDFVVSGPTYTADLAACLGRPTFIMAAISATLFFNKPDTGYSIFNPNAQIVPCRTPQERHVLTQMVQEFAKMNPGSSD